MKEIELGFWDEDDMEDTARNIIVVSNQIASIVSALKINSKISNKDMEVLKKNIKNVLYIWTGHTYIGCEKSPILKNAFQTFFQNLYMLLIQCKTTANNKLRKFAKKALYQGTLYRYLGYGDSNNENCRINPECNNIWVSWSKNKHNIYIASKLYGIVTHITCHTSQSLYGIDLSAFGILKTNEDEVVYPTITEQIDKIDYLS